MSTDQPSKAPGRRWLLGALGLLAFVLAAALAWRWLRPEPGPAAAPGPAPDPRLVFSTPYRNVRPEIRYVGSEACAGCHDQVAASFRHHPMGRSSAPAAELTVNLIGFLPTGQEPLPAAALVAARLGQMERYDAAAHDPFEAQGREHRVEPRGSQVLHRETLHDSQRRIIASLEAPACLAMGSGTRGRTYLIARGDSLVQSSISWYSQEGRWDLSPGYQHSPLHFERPVSIGCLYCHVNAVEPVAGSANRYRPLPVSDHAIGCERCHGPGELHVESRLRGETPMGLDPNIVNPSRLEPYLRDAVCEQCHLQGLISVLRAGRHWFDYRPGLPYHLFWSVFVLPEELSDHHKTVTTVEQMHASKCYQKSVGALGCTSCHDPHELPAPEAKAAYYRGRCQQCHGDDHKTVRAGRGLPRAPECTEALPVRRKTGDSCTACHMTPLTSSDIAHTANTDHRVPRRPDPTRTDPAPQHAPSPGQMSLVHFHRGLIAPDDRSTDRDVGIALATLATQQHDDDASRNALRLLEAALRDWPDDLSALEARASALITLGRIDEAATTYDLILTKAPGQEDYLLRAAELADKLKRHDRSVEYSQRALAINPNRAHTHLLLAQNHVLRNEWRQAAPELEATLRLNPFELRAHRLLLQCYVQMGDRVRAREQLDRLFGFNPPDRQALQDWFERRTRDMP